VVVTRVDIAAVRANAGPGVQQTFYPGTVNRRDAVAVRVGAGDVVKGIDITLAASDSFRITGHVLRTTRDGPVDAYLLWRGSSTRTLKVAEDGAFDIIRLTPGRYTIVAKAGMSDRREAAAITLDLTADAGGVLLSLMPTGSLSGRVVTVDSSPVPDGLQIAGGLAAGGQPVDPLTRDRVDVAAGGAFTIPDLFGERVIRLVGAGGEWTIERVMRGRSDVDGVEIPTGGAVTDLVVVVARK
jgi:hypothetical protein